MSRSRDRLTVACYVALIALIVAIMFGALPSVLPDLIAGRIARNSEGIVLLLILAAWIQFVRPRLAAAHRSDVKWPVTGAAAVVCLTIGVTLFLTEPVNAVKTLNETFLAAAILIPYVELPRPLPVRLPVATSLGLLVLVVVGHSTDVVTLTAEALGALILVPFGLDVVDRAILDPTARVVGWHRALWYAFLLAGPVVFWATDNGASTDGTAGVVLTYAGRTTEIFVCLLALQLYFAVGFGRTGVRDRARRTSAVAVP